MDYVEPAGGVSVLLRFKDGRNAKPFTERLLKEHETVVFPGYFFEVEEGFRLSFGVEQEQLSMGLEAISKTLDTDY